MYLKTLVLYPSMVILALCGSLDARTMVCAMSERSNSYYIAPEIVLSVLGYGEVSISDSIIASTGAKSIIGTVTSETSQKLSIYWEVRNLPADPKEFRASKPKLMVRLTIQKRDGAATLSAADLAQGNLRYRGKGVCRFEG